MQHLRFMYLFISGVFRTNQISMKDLFSEIVIRLKSLTTMHEKCSITEIFQVRIFPYSDWIRENADQKKHRIWTLFTLAKNF